MKLKTSFFDVTVFKKDITRFAPLWVLYLIVGFMHFFRSGIRAEVLESMISRAGFLSFLYAMLTAQLLFGDLFDERLCHALHAIPLRREGWFLTHFTAGILFSLVPNFLISLVMMRSLGQLWYTALIWLLGIQLQYVFFFGLSVLCVMVSGRRLAAVAVYMIFNFFALAAAWVDDAVFLPTHYGIINRTERYIPFLPLQGLSDESDYFSVIHSQNCPCRTWDAGEGIYVSINPANCDYSFGGFGTSWSYLIILAVIGVALAIMALLLYRKRNLESAGDFIAFRSLKPVFTVAYTFCAAAFAQKVGYEMEIPFYLFLGVGLVVGYFTSQMLLGRSLRVFKRRNWLALALAFVLAFGGVALCETDAFGIAGWTPEAQDVESATMALVPMNEPTQVQQLIDLHKLLYQQGPPDETRYKEYMEVNIRYKLKNGREVRRTYKTLRDGEIGKWVNWQRFANPQHALKADTLEELIASVPKVYVEGLWIEDEAQLQALLTALWKDAEKGAFYSPSGKNDQEIITSVSLRYLDNSGNPLHIHKGCENTLRWIEEFTGGSAP